MSPALGACKAVLGVQTDPREGLSLSQWAGPHAELEGWPRASACLRVTSEPQAEIPCGHRPPVLCGDWEGRRVSQTPCLLMPCDSRHRTPPRCGTACPPCRAVTSRTTGGKVPNPRQAHNQAPPLSPGIPQGRQRSESCPVEGSLGGQVLCPQAVWSSGSSGPQRLAEPAGTRTRPSRMPGGSPRPAPAPEHPWILAHCGVQPQAARGPGVPSQLCPCQPGQAPSPPWASTSSSVTKGQRCGAPRLGFTREMRHTVCPPTEGLGGRRRPLLTLRVISRPQTATLVPAASRQTAGRPARAQAWA